MGKLTKITHDLESNKVYCRVVYTVQSNKMVLDLTIPRADLVDLLPATISTALSAIVGFTVTPV